MVPRVNAALRDGRRRVAQRGGWEAEDEQGAVRYSSSGQGVGLFSEPDHDARTLAEVLNLQTIAGLFGNGEIGPVGSRVFLHGYTASIALIVPVTQPTASPGE